MSKQLSDYVKKRLDRIFGKTPREPLSDHVKKRLAELAKLKASVESNATKEEQDAEAKSEKN